MPAIKNSRKAVIAAGILAIAVLGSGLSRLSLRTAGDRRCRRAVEYWLVWIM